MKTHKAFCLNCEKETSYKLFTTRTEKTVKGTAFSYVKTSALCELCGEEILVPEINEANILSEKNAYRKAKHLITHTELLNLLKKYSIGAGPLAKLIGFGEVTINRYISGKAPSQGHSDFLLELNHNRRLMEELLESGKAYISLSAYNKCRSAIDRLNSLYSENKIDLIARYFLSENRDITPLTLQKLLYYAQAFYSAIFGDILFEDECQAWAWGPVYPNIYYKYRDFGYGLIENEINTYDDDFSCLTAKETDFLNSILNAFGRYSGKLLTEMSHTERPWIEARGNLKPQDRCITAIRRETINEYFAEIVRENEITAPDDIVKYSSALYNKVMQSCIH